MEPERVQILELDIVLTEVEPPVRRRVQVPGGMTLAALHQVVQSAVGWSDAHLHEFDIAGRRFGVPDPDEDDEPIIDETEGTLSGLVAAGDRFTYLYDFGDEWIHDITVERVVAPEPGVRYPRCVAGQGAGPLEDVGGPSGYDEFLAVLADPSHPEHEEHLEWAGAAFDPHRFDLEATDRALARWGWRISPGTGRWSVSRG